MTERNPDSGERRVLWLIPALLAVHNLEEAVTMPRFLHSAATRAPGAIGAVLAQVDFHGFLVALVIATSLPFAVVWWVWARPTSGAAVWTALCVQAVVAVNALWHAVVAIAVGGYTPGLATAVMVNAPFSVYLFRRASVERWTSRAALALVLPAALVVHGPVLLALLFFSGALQR